MTRKHYIFSEQVLEKLNALASQKNMSESAYISQLILDADARKNESLDALLRELRDQHAESLRAEHANGKLVSAIMDMLNSYFKFFANDNMNELAFHEADKEPHVWVTKALEAAEARIRMARYSKRRD